MNWLCHGRGDKGGHDVVHSVAVVLVEDVVQIAGERVRRGLRQLTGHVPRVLDGHPASVSSSAWWKVSVMPCAVQASLRYPASPTSAQPGPYGRRK